MSKIKVDSKCALYDGMSITFKAPCDSSAVDGMNVYYQNKKQTFTYRDAHGNNVSGRANLFSTGAYVKAILDTGKGYAYIQNADTNGYLDAKFDDFSTSIYTKSEILSDATKALYSKGANAVPDDLFHQLGKYNLHWWSKEPTPTYQDVVKTQTISSSVRILPGSINGANVIHYSSSVSKSGDTVVLNNPKSVNLTFSSSSESAAIASANSLLALAPCYFTTSNQDASRVFYLPEGASLMPSATPSADRTLYIPYEWIDEDGETIEIYFVTAYKGANNPIKEVSIVTELVPGEVEYLTATNRNAHPDYGNVDGYLYKYLGIPFNNAVASPRIEFGSYVGTGKHGSSNPCILTFGFEPKAVLITCHNAGTRPIWVNGQTSGAIFCDHTTTGSCSLTWSGNTLSWSSSGGSPNRQLNISGTTYHYVAIG